MKQRFLLLLALALPFCVGNAWGQGFHEVTSEETYQLTKAVIQSTDFITNSKDNWQNAKTYCDITGDFYNMSSTDRSLTFKVKNVESFAVTVQNTNSNRTYIVTVDGKSNTVTHSGDKCETEIFVTDNTGEIEIVVSGGGSSVYPASITFYPPTGPSKDVTLSAVTVDGNSAAIAEEGAGYDFEYELPFDQAEGTVTVLATPRDANAKVVVENEGVITVPAAGAFVDVAISVTPVSGETDKKEYKLHLSRQLLASSDNSVDSLKIDGVKIEAGDEGKYIYEIPYAYEGALVVVVYPKDDKAVVSSIVVPEIAGGASADLPFTVTAHNGDVANYSLTITRTAPSAACQLTSFRIGGFASAITELDVKLKVLNGYDLSDEPVMSVSQFATPAWDKDAKTVVVTAQDGTIATYNVVVSDITPLSELPVDIAFGTEYTTPEWIWGANYNSGLLNTNSGGNTTEIVGGFDIASDNAANKASGTNKLNMYLTNCGSITVKMAATGGRTVSLYVNGVKQDKTVALAKAAPTEHTFDINSNAPVHAYFIAEGSNGGTRVYNLNITAATPTGLENSTVDALKVWSADGILYIASDKAQSAKLYTLDGRLVSNVDLTEGNNTINGLARGIYLMNNLKVVVK